MKARYGFVGDIHGDSSALRLLLNGICFDQYKQIIFLGDYIDRGPNSREVIDCLIPLSKDKRFVFLLGNHEERLLSAFKMHDLGRFIEVGGSATIKSYLPGILQGDILRQLIEAMPRKHFNFFASLKKYYTTIDLAAAHILKQLPKDGRYRIAGHNIVGTIPVINEKYALIDTGCGVGGRLTFLEWPSLNYMQFPSFDLTASK